MEIGRANFLNRFISTAFLLASLFYFINFSTSMTSLKIDSYMWLFIFMAGIIFGVIHFKSSEEEKTFDKILAIFVICISGASLGLFAFFYFLANSMGA